jgi:hypothetical protein
MVQPNLYASHEYKKMEIECIVRLTNHNIIFFHVMMDVDYDVL